MAGQREGRGQDWFKYANVDEILLRDWAPLRYYAKALPDSTSSSELSIDVLAKEIIGDKGLPHANSHDPHDNSDVLLVDIGGGTGHDLAAFTAAKPELFTPLSPYRLILQDLPKTIDLAHTKNHLSPLTSSPSCTTSSSLSPSRAHAPTTSVPSSTTGLTRIAASSCSIRSMP